MVTFLSSSINCSTLRFIPLKQWSENGNIKYYQNFFPPSSSIENHKFFFAIYSTIKVQNCIFLLFLEPMILSCVLRCVEITYIYFCKLCLIILFSICHRCDAGHFIHIVYWQGESKQLRCVDNEISVFHLLQKNFKSLWWLSFRFHSAPLISEWAWNWRVWFTIRGQGDISSIYSHFICLHSPVSWLFK